MTRRADLPRQIVTAIAAIAIGCYVWIQARADVDPPIHSDGYNYYLYAASWVAYHDGSLDAVSADWYGGAYPDFAGMVRWPGTNRWLNRMPIGVAVMMLPFVGAADLLSRWSNLPRDGYSLFYQHAAAIAALTYFIVGLAFMRRTLQRHFSPAVTAATLVVVTFGTDLFHYAVYDGTFSHAFSFALIALLVELCDRWWIRPMARTALSLGAVCGLIVLVRHTNALLLLVVPLWQWRNAATLWHRRSDLLLMAAAAAIVFAPQLAYYKWVTGLWIVNPYASTGLRLDFLSPHFFGVLLSPQRGLFFWAPVLLTAIGGVIVARGWAREVRSGAVIVLVAFTWLVASWSEWQYGASFGQRPFIDVFPIVAIYIAAFFEWTAERPPLTVTVGAVVSLAVLLSVAQMVQYWLHIWPARDITWDRYRALFLTFQ